jgi:16S rRNA (uracil1498-N3)-methyltransferase
MHTAYHPELVSSADQITLSEEESMHAIKVLRMTEGQQVQIANGKGLKAVGTILQAHAKRCMLTLSDFQERKAAKKYIHLAIAPTKNMDRMTWLVEKTTELGVDKITLLKCANSERGNIRLDKLEKTALSAMKQSQRFFLPEIEDLIPFKEFIKTNPKGMIAHCEDGIEEFKKTALQEVKQNGPLLIGPEGDFRKEEIQMAIDSGYTAVDLGSRRLRTETAGLMGVVLLTVDH